MSFPTAATSGQLSSRKWGGVIDVASLISHTPPLSDGVEVFSRFVGRTQFMNKVVFAL